MEDGIVRSATGDRTGRVIRQLMANIYCIYVLDLWTFLRTWRTRGGHG